MRYYFDTCIWIDYLNERDKYVVDVVFKIFATHQVIVSKVVLKELERFIPGANILNLKNVILVEIVDTQKILASNLSKKYSIPLADAVHAIVARDNDAILLTRDKHFLKLTGLGEIRLL
ncbi:MAG: PIN domain-containing protein [Candidatus Woesearchaeota archaeon]